MNYYEKHKEERKNYYLKNKEKYKKYYEDNKDRIRKYYKEYYEKKKYNNFIKDDNKTKNKNNFNDRELSLTIYFD